jgi:PAS domain S-box-containing protein
VLRELKLLCMLIEQIEPEYKRAAVQPIRKLADANAKLQHNVKQAQSDARLSALFVCILILYGAMGVLTVCQFVVALKANSDFEMLNHWKFTSVALPSLCMELSQTAVMLIAVANNTATDVSNKLEQTAIINRLLDHVSNQLSGLLNGQPGAPTIVGHLEALDNILLGDVCDIVLDDKSAFHDTYRCTSVSHTLSLYLEIVHQVLAKIDMYRGEMDTLESMTIYHIMECHLVPRLERFNEILTDDVVAIRNNYHTTLIILFIFGLMLAVLAAAFIAMYKGTIDHIYSGAMIFLRRCSPAGIVANKDLLVYLLDQSDDKAAMMTVTQGIIHTARDAIVLMSQLGIVESANLSVTQILGFIPEQILGQSVATIFAEADAPRLLHRMEMMTRRECPRTFTAQMTCLTDREEEVVCSVTLLSMEDSANASGFVLIVRNITEEKAQQFAAERAKKRSEDLLYDILPRDIVNRLNQ